MLLQAGAYMKPEGCRHSQRSAFAAVIALSVVVPASGALAQAGPAFERCRNTVGRPIVQACMQAGGSREACREKARPQIKACAQTAGGGGPKAGGEAKGGREAKGGDEAGKGPGAGRSPAAPMVGRARQLVQNGRFAPAIELLDKAIKLDPGFTGAWTWRGTAKQRMGQARESLSDFDKAIELDPGNAFALGGRGYTHYILRNPAQAKVDSDAATAIDPNLPGPYATRGVLLSDDGNLAKALEELNQSIKLEGRYIPAYMGLGGVYIKLQEFEKAIAAYDKAIAGNPTNYRIRHGRAFAYQSLGDNDRALADYNAVLKANPKFARSHVNRGRIYIDKGDYESALKDFDAALKEVPDNIPALLQRARTFELKRDLDKARADYKAVLAMAATHSVAVAGVERIDAKKKASKDQGSASEGGRVALVVGNSKYKTFDKLANPERDAKLIAGTFERSGFRKVRLVLDAGKAELAAALEAFTKDAAGADWAVVYFAGHGIELDGSNYLVPVDARYETDPDIPVESVALDQTLNAVGGALRLRLVILDACRENPFGNEKKGEASNAGRGLARIEPESGTLVAFATKHGHLASDGAGENSPFAAALAKRIETPGLEINRLFRLVHDDVLAATAKKQEPFTYGQLSAEEFYFRSR
jgi:tetratricopeptide (TPR) repeat protein